MYKKGLQAERRHDKRTVTWKGHCIRWEVTSSVILWRWGSDVPLQIPSHGHTEDSRLRGRPRKRWLDNVAEDCEMLHLSVLDANRLAHNRQQWRSAIWNCEVGAAGACWLVNVAMAWSQVKSEWGVRPSKSSVFRLLTCSILPIASLPVPPAPLKLWHCGAVLMYYYYYCITVSDGDVRTDSGRLFQTDAAAAGKARSPTVARRYVERRALMY